MRRLVSLIVLGGCCGLVAACGGENLSVELSSSVAVSASTAQVTPSRESDMFDSHSLPSIETVEVDRTDHASVAYHFVLFSTTFAPGPVVDEKNQVERGFPLTTEKYRDDHPTLEANPDIVRLRSWYNQKTRDDDPVVFVGADVQWLLRPSPILPDVDRTDLLLRSTQTPVTESGRKMPSRVLDYIVVVVKQEDGTWLVDEATSTVATNG